jgi:hypothetical protein
MKMAVFWVLSRVFTDVSQVLAALIMKAASTSETSVNFHRIRQRNIPEDIYLHIQPRFLTQAIKTVVKQHSIRAHVRERCS